MSSVFTEYVLLLCRADETTVPPVPLFGIFLTQHFSFSNIHIYVYFSKTITFPECEQKFLADCLEILNQELYQLELDAEIVVHEKRNIDQSGYNKVVIVTDLSATSVQGGDNDGKVLYPFLWDDAISGPHMIGVDGKFDCLNVSPQDCCNIIKTSTPNPDTKGNYIDCHFMVEWEIQRDRIVSS